MKTVTLPMFVPMQDYSYMLAIAAHYGLDPRDIAENYVRDTFGFWRIGYNVEMVEQ